MMEEWSLLHRKPSVSKLEASTSDGGGGFNPLMFFETRLKSIQFKFVKTLEEYHGF